MTATQYLGPYDVSDYKTWQEAIDVAIPVGGTAIYPVQWGSKVAFILRD